MKEEHRVVFKWPMTVEAESEEEAKKIASNLLLEHLSQVRIKPGDFEIKREEVTICEEERCGKEKNHDGKHASFNPMGDPVERWE